MSFWLAFPVSGVSTNSAWFARVWQTDDGLPHNSVNGVAQGADGFLWLALPTGLARFDGHRFDEIPSASFIEAPNRGVLALTGSRKGGLWLATDRGSIVNLEAGTRHTFTATNGLLDRMVAKLLEDSNGTLWIAYMDGTICSLRAGEVTVWDEKQQVPAGRVASVVSDTAGRIWLIRGGQLGRVEDGKFRGMATVPKVAYAAAARDGGIWVCSERRLEHFEEAGGLKPVATFLFRISSVDPLQLLEDSGASVWIGTPYDGLYRLVGGQLEKVGGTAAQILAVTEDREGNVWVGTRGRGLNRLRPRAVRLEGEEEGLPFEAVQSVCEDSTGTLWATTATGQLARRLENRWVAFSTNEWRNGPATALAAGTNGEVWIGTRNHRLVRWQDGRFETFSRSRGVEASPILTLLAGRDGDLWIGGQNQVVQRMHAGVFQTLKTPEDPRSFRACAQDASGNIWFGTSKGMLLRADGDTLLDETARVHAPLDPVRCLTALPDGTLWIGYADAGLGRLKDGRVALISSNQGLFDNAISEIVGDDRGWLWFGSDHGIFKVARRELDDVADGKAVAVRSIHYGAGEGVPNFQAEYGYSPESVRSRDGRLWISARSALAVVDPAEIRQNLEAPPVLLRRVAIDEKSIAEYVGMAPARGAAALDGLKTALRLPAGHRKLEFEFTALSFTAVENVRFRHRLDGFDGNWIEGTERSASYPRLPAGDYRFQVKACNSDGIWTETPATIAFIVAPFVWQTWWFRAGALAFFLAVVVVTVRYVSFRNLRNKLRALEQQAALDRERARIARDLHDDLGSRLTRIVLLSDLITDNGSEPDKSIGNAQEISSTARQVIKALDETVWAVNPRNDQLPHVVSYIGQFAVEFLRTAGIRARVELPELVAERPVSAEVRHNLFLVVKEALNNMVRHAAATEAVLRVMIDEESIALDIEDNGQGFSGAAADDGADGLRNMRQRMEEIGGRFELDSRRGSGTKISFYCPCPAGKT
jgi:signal transduction histidine kinase/ligand-binding sensor domain-containing protein